MNTEETTKRVVRICTFTGKLDILHPNQLYHVVRVWLPEGAPAECLEASWKDGQEPRIDSLPPSDVVNIIAKKFAREQSGTERQLAVIGWCRTNYVMLDKLWAQWEVECAKKRIEEAQQLIVELTENYIETEED